MSSENKDSDDATRIIFTILPDAVEVDWQLSEPVGINAIVKTLAALNSGVLIGIMLESLSQYCDEMGLNHISKQIYDMWTAAIEKKSKSGPLIKPTQIFHD